MMRSRLLLFVLLTAACLFVLQACTPIPLLLLNRSQPRNRLSAASSPRLRGSAADRVPTGPTPIPVPTEVPVPPNGQIVFRYEANLWRYLVDAEAWNGYF